MAEQGPSNGSLYPADEHAVVAAILQSSPAPIYVKDTAGRYLIVSGAYERLFGRMAGDVCGKSDYDLFPRVLAQTYRTNDLQVMKSREPAQYEETALQADGPHIFLSLKFPIVRNDGTLLGVGGISTDITAQKHLQSSVREERRKLVQALGRERAVVRKLARTFLGKLPKIHDYKFAACYQAAEETDRVGGDFYDFIRLGSRLGIVVGDVCGKGLSAAIYTSKATCMLRYYALACREDVEETIRRVNQGLCVEMAGEELYLTLFYGLLERATGRLRYVNAGHPAAVLHHRGSRPAELLQATGGIVGIFSEMDFRVAEATLEPGSALTLVTDGVTEAGRDLSLLADGGVCEMLQRTGWPDAPQQIVDSVFAEARTRARGRLLDDVAIVAVRRNGAGSPA